MMNGAIRKLTASGGSLTNPFQDTAARIGPGNRPITITPDTTINRLGDSSAKIQQHSILGRPTSTTMSGTRRPTTSTLDGARLHLPADVLRLTERQSNNG